MAVRTKFLQIGIAIVNIAIVALVFTSVWPFPSGEFSVDLPSANDVQWSYSDGNVHVIAPYTIHNGWIYDVNDLVLDYSVTNLERTTLSQNSIRIGTIPAGKVTSSHIDFTFNLTRLYGEGVLGMVFRDDSLHFDIGVTCFYTMKLIKFEASYQAEVPWDALIRAYGVSAPRWTGSSVAVDYYVETSSILAPLGSVPVILSLYDGNGNLLIPLMTQVLRLGTNSTGTLTFAPTTPSTLPSSLEVHFEVLGYQFVKRWP
jgi:hypothetical protein